MKRYVLFCGDNYYPLGGYLDFLEDFDYLRGAEENAKELLDNNGCGWYHILDTETHTIVAQDSKHMMNPILEDFMKVLNKEV